MYEKFRQRSLEANKRLPEAGLVDLLFGNVSVIDRETGAVAIKPSGTGYEGLTAEKLSVVDLDGRPLEEGLKASSDTPTHLCLYRAFSEIGAVFTHTHELRHLLRKHGKGAYYGQ